MELTIQEIFDCFKNDNFKGNAIKYHFFLSDYKSTPINISGSTLKSSNSENLLDVIIDSSCVIENITVFLTKWEANVVQNIRNFAIQLFSISLDVP